MNWAQRYASKEYEDARNEYIQRFIRPGNKDTPEAKEFYARHVAPLKTKKEKEPEPEVVNKIPGDEQLSFDDMPEPTSGNKMSWEKAMGNPHFDGQGWMPGTKGPRIV